MSSSYAKFKARLKDDRGAEAVEFAFVGPIMFFLLLAVLYVLFMLAAQLSVARAATVGVRYAAIRSQTLGAYPTAAQIQTNVLNSTALFAAGACTATMNPVTAPNAPITLNVTCQMANPIGQVFPLSDLCCLAAAESMAAQLFN